MNPLFTWSVIIGFSITGIVIVFAVFTHTMLTDEDKRECGVIVNVNRCVACGSLIPDALPVGYYRLCRGLGLLPGEYCEGCLKEMGFNAILIGG